MTDTKIFVIILLSCQLSDWNKGALVESIGTITFDDVGCDSCISILDIVSYTGLPVNLSVLLANETEINIGTVTNGKQIVAMTSDDSMAPVMSSIKVSLERNGSLIERILTGPDEALDVLYVVVGEVVTLDVTIQTQIDVLFGVDYGESISVTESCEGKITSFKLLHTYISSGQYQLNVEASSVISNRNSTLSIEVIYFVNNVNASDNSIPDLIEPNDMVSVDIIANGINMPIGNTFLRLRCGTLVTYEQLTLSGDGTQTVMCNMSESGTHYMIVDIVSPVSDNQLYSRSFRVWDNLKFEFVPSAVAFVVGNTPTFTFNNPPIYNFEYIIDFGEGTVLNTSDAPNLSTRFTGIDIPVLNYSVPGSYLMQVTGSNLVYTKSQNITLIFEYGIPPSHIRHDISRLLLCPPGDVLFSTYAYSDISEPMPTDVNCTFNFGDGIIEYASNDPLQYDGTGLAMTVGHVYTTEDIMYVMFVCENRVSRILMNEIIDARLMNVEIIQLTYHNVLLINNTEPVTFDIEYAVLNYTYPPPNLTHAITWEVGQFLSVSEMTTLSDSTTYSQRDTFLVTIFFEYYSLNRTDSKYVRVGALDFYLLSSRIGQTNTTEINFTLKRYLLTVNHAISIDWGDGSASTEQSYTRSVPSVLQTPAETTESHTFIKPGNYIPVVTYASSRGTEILNLNDTIHVENEIKDLQIATKERYTLADDIIPVITLGNESQPVKNISCYFNYTDNGLTVIGDLVNDTSSIQANIIYSHLGEKFLLVTCSNYLSEQTINASYLVFSVCFDSSRLFERAHMFPYTALRLYTSNTQILTGRAILTDICKNRTSLEYKWKIELVNDTGFQEISIEQQPNSISLIILKFLSEPGIYRIELTLFFPDFPDDYISDFTYIELIDPPLIGLIDKGTERSVSIGIPVDFDAKSKSYDPKVGYGIDDPLIHFSWNCYFITDNSTVHIYTKPYSSDKTYKTLPSCDLNLPSQGLITNIDTSTATANTWLLVEVIVSKGTRFVTAIQIVFINALDAPLLGISCRLNCLQKVLPDDITYFESSLVCPSCNQAQLDNVTYLWSYYKNNNSSDDRQQWNQLISTARTDKDFRTEKHLFEEGVSYLIEVEARIPGKDMGQATIRVNTNAKPYGGRCKIEPETGWSTVTRYQAVCYDWKDEAIREKTNVTVDTGEVIIYRVEQITRSGNVVLYEGGERITPPFLMQICDEADDYMCDVVIRVFDFLGSEVNVTHQINVQSPLGYYLSKANNETNGTEITEDEILEQYFDRMYRDINVTLGYDSIVITVITCSTYASVLNSISLPPSSVNDAELIYNNDSLLAGRKILDGLRIVDPMEDKVKEMLEHVITTITDSIRIYFEREDITVPFILHVITSLLSSIKDPVVISGKTQIAILETTVYMSNSLIEKMKVFVTIKEIFNSMEAISALQDKIIDIGAPDMSGSLPDSTSYSFVNYDPQGDGFTPYEQEDYRKLMDQRIRANADRFIKNAQETITVCQTLWENAFKILETAIAGNTAFSTVNKNFAVELIKGTVLNIQNGKNYITLGYNVSVDLDGVEKDKKSADITTVILKKNIYIQGENSPIYNSPVVHESVSGLPMVKPTIGYNHPQQVGFTYIKTPKFIDEDASFMFYWRFMYRHRFEHVCISIQPTINNIKYDVFWRSKIAPSDFEYDFSHQGEDVTDWGIQLDVCIKPGELKRLGAGFIGLRPYIVDSNTKSKRSVNNERNTSTIQTGVGGNPDSDNPLESPYYIRLLSFSCATWNGVKQDWDPANCEIEIDLIKNWTNCLCQSRTNQIITASSFFVPPNSIDFSTVFSKFDIQSQAAVLATILIITLLAMLVGIWGHWRDRHDKLEWGVTLLADNYEDDTYFFLVTVYTGLVRSGGTRSNIKFNLSGERGDTGVRSLTDGIRQEFTTGSVMHFLMSVPAELGPLQCLRVWHDNSGKGRKASWYLNRIEVHDIQTNDRYDFLCSNWLSIDVDTIERMLPVSGTVNFNNFKTMFYEHANNHITDDHLWLSVFLRPVKSHFSRVQRIGCVYTLLMLTMIANAMFFESKDQKNRQQLSQIELGPIRFSLSQIYISFVSIIITTIPIFLIILLFRKSKIQLKDKKKINPPSWMPNFMKEHIEYSNKLEDALVIRDIVDDKEGVLPYFCVYISWIIIVISVFTSAFFLMLYSMEWGKSLSEEWLTSFFLSFVQSIIVVDPFKVILLAVVFALFLKAIKSSKPTHYELKEIQLLAAQKGLPNSGRRQPKFTTPFSDEQFHNMKLQRERNNRMQKTVKELISNGLFLWLLFSISYSNRDRQSFLLHEYIDNNILQPPKGYRTFAKIREAAHLFDWLNSTALPTLFKEDDYRGYRMVSSQRLFSYDVHNFRVGPPRLRQVRAKNEICDYPYLGKSMCIPSYFVTAEDTDTYCIGWTKTPCPDHEKLALTYDAWTFTSAADIWGYPIAGDHNVYGGGGYIANLDVNKLISVESLKELFESRWIDRNTRAVFFEFTLYNVNLNIFIYVSLLTEFPETGGTITFRNIYPFRPSQHEGAQGGYVLFCELVFVGFILAYIIMIIMELARQRLKYFKQFWNIIDLIVVCFAIASIAVYAVREGFTADALKKYRDNNRLFVNFYHVAMWDGTFVGVLGFLVSIATLRLIKALGYTNMTLKVYNVLKNSAKVLPGLSFYVFVMVASFSFTGLLLFGRTAVGYKSFINCVETLFTAVVGSPYFKNTNTEVGDHWITVMYFCTFVILVPIILSNLFLAILLDVISMTESNDIDEKKLDMELISFIWKSFLGVFTGRPPDMDRIRNGRYVDDVTKSTRVHHPQRVDAHYVDEDIDEQDEIPYLLTRSNSMSSID